MLDSYVETLVKEAAVQKRLDSHLEKLALQAAKKEEQERFLKNASVEELAKLAGITLPEDICGGCGSQMVKQGSLLQCHCGRLKKASQQKTALIAIPGASHAISSPISGIASRAVGRFARGGTMAAPTAAQKAAPLLTGAGGGELTAKELASAQGPVRRMAGKASQAIGGLKQKLVGAPVPQLQPKTAAKKDMPHFTDQDRPEKVKEIYRAIKREHPSMPAAMKARIAARQGKPGKQHQGPPYKGPLTKSASVSCFMKALNVSGGDVDRALAQLEKEGYTKLAFSLGAVVPALKSVGTKALGAAKPALNAVKGKAQQVAGTFQTARQGGAGVGQSLLQTAKAHPGVAAGAIGAAGMGAGAALAPNQPKVASLKLASLINIGDAAGRMLAKLAEGTLIPNLTGQPTLTPEEMQEAVEGAKEREDVEGRAQSWGRGGALLGAAGGGAAGAGAGYGLGKLLGFRAPLGAGVGGAAGAVLGGLYGRRIGQAEGAEEAVADKLVSMLRARRAFGMGAGQGYMAGLGQGTSEFPRESEEGPQ